MPQSADSLYPRNTGVSVPDGTREAPWVVAGRPAVGTLARRFLRWPGLLWTHRDLTVVCVRRDLAARFRGTLLGFAWVLAHPLLLFAVYAFLFTEVLGLRLGAGAAPAGTLGIYMFTGILVWSALNDALTRSTTCILEQRHLVQKLRFPAELLPVQAGLASLVPFAAGLLAFALFTTLTPVWPAPPVELLLWAPLLLVLQLLFTSGLGLGLAACQVALRDTREVLGVVLTVGMFLTPIFWVPSPELLPGVEPWLGLVELNPAHHLVYLWREVLMGGRPAVVFGGSFAGSLLQLALWSVASFAAGSWLFFRAQRHFADEV